MYGGNIEHAPNFFDPALSEVFIAFVKILTFYFYLKLVDVLLYIMI